MHFQKQETFTKASTSSTENEAGTSLEGHCFIGMIRHAEKANLHEVNNPRWVVDKDPPLSTRGDRQATFTGKYLKDYFEAR